MVLHRITYTASEQCKWSVFISILRGVIKMFKEALRVAGSSCHCHYVHYDDDNLISLKLALGSLKLSVLLLQPPKCCCYTGVPPCPDGRTMVLCLSAYSVLTIERARVVSFVLLYFSPPSRWVYAYSICSKNPYQTTLNCSENARFVSIEEAHLNTAKISCDPFWY